MADERWRGRGKNYSIIAVFFRDVFIFDCALGSSTNLAIPKIAIDMDISSSMATWIVQIGLITRQFCWWCLDIWVISYLKMWCSSRWDRLFGRVHQLPGCAELRDYFIWSGDSSNWLGTDYGQLDGNCDPIFPDKRRAEALAVISMFISVGSISGPGIGVWLFQRQLALDLLD